MTGSSVLPSATIQDGLPLHAGAPQPAVPDLA